MLVLLLTTLLLPTVCGLKDCQCHFPPHGNGTIGLNAKPEFAFAYNLDIGLVLITPIEPQRHDFETRVLRLDEEEIEEHYKNGTCVRWKSSKDAFFPLCPPIGETLKTIAGYLTYWYLGDPFFAYTVASGCKPQKVRRNNHRWTFQESSESTLMPESSFPSGEDCVALVQ